MYGFNSLSPSESIDIVLKWFENGIAPFFSSGFGNITKALYVAKLLKPNVCRQSGLI